ncbi:MAG: endo-1,4-beta-xylanase [Planctomycetota bacterium]|nr:endo-1,4-beta-xylanase [Planctomycetota bacterium]
MDLGRPQPSMAPQDLHLPVASDVGAMHLAAQIGRFVLCRLAVPARSALILPMRTLRQLACVLALLASAGAALAQTAAQPQEKSLRRAAANLFEIGVGINDHIADRAADHALLLAQFSIVTPENCMKPAQVQAVQGKWNFTRADAFVDFAAKNGLKVVGHCLVWAKDDRTPEWFFRDAQKPAGRQLLLDRIRQHIETEVMRYRGRIAMWDVVNEALDDGAEYLRPSGWSTACGEEFIAKAFEYAHAADPKAMLIYNDYNNELPGKREKQIRLLRSLREKNVPLHAIGLQGHYEIDRVPFKDIEDTLIAMRPLGVKVVISELDIDVIPRGKWWAEGGKYREELSRLDPYPMFGIAALSRAPRSAFLS